MLTMQLLATSLISGYIAIQNLAWLKEQSGSSIFWLVSFSCISPFFLLTLHQLHVADILSSVFMLPSGTEYRSRRAHLICACVRMTWILNRYYPKRVASRPWIASNRDSGRIAHSTSCSTMRSSMRSSMRRVMRMIIIRRLVCHIHM